MKLSPLIVLVLIILAGGGGFYGGMEYQEKKIASSPQEFFSSFAPGAGQGRMLGLDDQPTEGRSPNQTRIFGGNQIIGKITALDDESATVKTADNSSKIVIINSKTKISETKEVSLENLVVGNKVAILGSTNDNGSLTAENIQLDPLERRPQ